MAEWLRKDDGVEIQLTQVEYRRLEIEGKIQVTEKTKVTVTTEQVETTDHSDKEPASRWSDWFEASIPKYGQTRIPKGVRDELGIKEGRIVEAEVKRLGQKVRVVDEAKSGCRFTINKSEREKLGSPDSDNALVRVRRLE